MLTCFDSVPGKSASEHGTFDVTDFEQFVIQAMLPTTVRGVKCENGWSRISNEMARSVP